MDLEDTDGVVYDRYEVSSNESSDDSDSDNGVESKKNRLRKGKEEFYKIKPSAFKNEEGLESEEEEKCEQKLPEYPTQNPITQIGNKLARSKLFKRMHKKKKAARKQLRELKVKEAQMKGIKLKKEVPKTIESKRVEDLTVMHMDDEDLITEESTDKYASYYDKSYEPKVLITGSERLNGKSIKFIRELCLTIPNSFPRWRNKTSVKKVVEDAKKKDFTDIIIINEDHRKPDGLLLVHLPEGPTAYFRLSSIKLCREIKKKRQYITSHRPEVILSNFKTRLGRTVSRMLAAIYHFDPEFKARGVVTLHNQRDYIFFRHHRYQFRNNEKVNIRELGPRFTLRLQWIKDGAFEGDFEWLLKRHEMETSRTKFNL